MVATSFWYVSLAPPETIAAARTAIETLVEGSLQDVGFHEALDAWRATPDAIGGPGPAGGSLSTSAADFLRGFQHLQLTESQLLSFSVPETEPTTWDLAGDRPEPCDGLFVAVRGLPVTSLLLMGLGPLRAQWLPGSFGLFALTHQEVVEAADGIRHAHAMSPADRAATIGRMHDWLSVGSDPGVAVHHLLEGLPEVTAAAVARSAGMISLTARSD